MCSLTKFRTAGIADGHLLSPNTDVPLLHKAQRSGQRVDTRQACKGMPADDVTGTHTFADILLILVKLLLPNCLWLQEEEPLHTLCARWSGEGALHYMANVIPGLCHMQHWHLAS